MHYALRLAICALLLLPCAASAAQAQGARHLARFYYSELVAGDVKHTPLDPDGLYSSQTLTAGSKGELEVILWRRVGLGASRQVVARKFMDAAGQDLRENWVQYSANLTLYALESRHDTFNLFAGGGAGSVERYKSSIDGQPQPIPSLHTDLPLVRYFAGIEYTFDRIGFRLEVSRADARKTDNGQTAELTGQSFQHFTVYIPFN